MTDKQFERLYKETEQNFGAIVARVLPNVTDRVMYLLRFSARLAAEHTAEPDILEGLATWIAGFECEYMRRREEMRKEGKCQHPHKG